MTPARRCDTPAAMTELRTRWERYKKNLCVVPSVVSNIMGVRFQFGGTALLIVVGVALDTVQQIEGHLISRNYEGFAGPRGPRIRGRARVAA